VRCAVEFGEAESVFEPEGFVAILPVENSFGSLSNAGPGPHGDPVGGDFAGIERAVFNINGGFHGGAAGKFANRLGIVAVYAHAIGAGLKLGHPEFFAAGGAPCTRHGDEIFMLRPALREGGGAVFVDEVRHAVVVDSLFGQVARHAASAARMDHHIMVRCVFANEVYAPFEGVDQGIEPEKTPVHPVVIHPAAAGRLDFVKRAVEATPVRGERIDGFIFLFEPAAERRDGCIVVAVDMVVVAEPAAGRIADRVGHINAAFGIAVDRFRIFFGQPGWNRFEVQQHDGFHLIFFAKVEQTAER